MLSGLAAVVRRVGRGLDVLLDLADDPLGLAHRTWRASEDPHRRKHWVRLDADGNVLAQGLKPTEGSPDSR